MKLKAKTYDEAVTETRNALNGDETLWLFKKEIGGYHAYKRGGDVDSYMWKNGISELKVSKIQPLIGEVV